MINNGLCSWFHGDVNNDEAADLLKSKPEGTFLFRFSSRKGYLTVSFIADGQLQHTLIQPTANGYICNGRSHNTLQEVVSANSDKFKIPLETLTFIVVPKYENRVDNQRVQTPTNYISIPMSSPGSIRSNQNQTSTNTPDSSNYADLPSSSSVDDLEKSSSKDKKKLKHLSSKDKKEKKNKDKDKNDKKRTGSMSKRSSKAHIQQPINSSGSQRDSSGSSTTTTSYVDISAATLQHQQDTPTTAYGVDGSYVDTKDLRKQSAPPVNFNNVNANNIEYNLGVPQDMQGESSPYDVIPLSTRKLNAYWLLELHFTDSLLKLFVTVIAARILRITPNQILLMWQLLQTSLVIHNLNKPRQRITRPGARRKRASIPHNTVFCL